MTDIPGLFTAFLAGLLSFVSPCVLPLIPVYLSFITGESVTAVRAGKRSKAFLLGRSLLFVSGFTLIFVLLAIVFGGGMSFAGNRVKSVITKTAGVAVILLAVNMIFDFVPFLRGTLRIATNQSATAVPRIRSPISSVLLGMAFAAGWTPCVGPILSSILAYAGSSASVMHAALLLAFYSAGLGLPFILTGVFLDRVVPVLGVFKRHSSAIRIVTAALLIILAVPMVFR